MPVGAAMELTIAGGVILAAAVIFLLLYDPGAGEKLKIVKKYTDKFGKNIHMTHKALYLMELIALYEEIW